MGLQNTFKNSAFDVSKLVSTKALLLKQDYCCQGKRGWLAQQATRAGHRMRSSELLPHIRLRPFHLTLSLPNLLMFYLGSSPPTLLVTASPLYPLPLSPLTFTSLFPLPLVLVPPSHSPFPLRSSPTPVASSCNSFRSVFFLQGMPALLSGHAIHLLENWCTNSIARSS